MNLDLPKRISRRTILKGVGAAVSLPVLDIMAPSIHAATSFDSSEVPTRLAYLYFPNGASRGSWKPEHVDRKGSLVKLNRWMKPLEKLKDYLTIPQNVWTPRGNGHRAGTATWLTGGGYDERKINVGGPSVDQIAAEAIGKKTLLPSLQLSVKGEGYFSGNLPRNCISWKDARTPLSRDTLPRVVFDRMFRTGRANSIDKSVVDLVRQSAKDILRQGSYEDRQKINQYLESIRSVERRLDFAASKTSELILSGDKTETLLRPAAGVPSDHREYVRLMLDLIALAFWSDATRISTFMLDHGQSNRYFNFIEQCKGTWHALSHYRDISGRTEDDDGVTSWNSMKSKRDMYNRVTMWHHEQFAYLLERLSQMQDKDGNSVLDNSAICYGSSLADGNEHGEKDLPLIIAGRAGGSIDSGRYIPSKRDQSMSRLHLALLQSANIDVEEFAGAKDPMSLS